MPIRGWVYVIENKAMPGLLKVGYSTKDPVLRAKELASTGSPRPYCVVFDALVEGPRSIERATHVLLASHREGKEWFRCSQVEAIKAIRACAAKIYLERSVPNENEIFSSPLQSTLQMARCYYYNCPADGTSSYKGISYCPEHYKLMRNHRFDLARGIRRG